MGSRAFLLLGLLFAIFLFASEVSAIELAETEQSDETNGLEESKMAGGGYGGCFCRYCCRCCSPAAGAEAYAAAQAKAKPQN